MPPAVDRSIEAVPSSGVKRLGDQTDEGLRKKNKSHDYFQHPHIFNENYSHFITSLTKENGITYRMKRSKGYIYV